MDCGLQNKSIKDMSADEKSAFEDALGSVRNKLHRLHTMQKGYLNLCLVETRN